MNGINDFNTSPSFYGETRDIYIKERQFDGFERAFAWICVILGYLFCLAFPPADNPLGVLIVHTAALAVTAVMLSKRKASFGFFSLASAAISFAFAFSVILTSNKLVIFLAVLCAAIAYSYFVYSATGNCIEKGFSDFVVVDLFHALFVCPFFSFGKVFKAVFSRKGNGAKRLLKVVCGFLIAIIPTSLVIVYLSYDSGFMELIDGILDVIRNLNLTKHLFSFLFGIVLAMYFFGAYTTATNEEKTKAIEAEDVKALSKNIKVAPMLTVASALLPLLTVYVIFFISQWQYYVSGFTGELPEGVLSYAEYARSGFFELCSVSIINFVVLVVVALFLRRNGKAGEIFLKAASVIISLMTLVLIGTAMAKMYLYIDRFGLTEKRLLSSWLMVLLAIVFVLVIVRQFVPRLKIIASGVAVLSVMLVVLACGNHDRIIAEHNIDMFIGGKTETVDIDMLDELGSSADVALVRLAEFWDNETLSESQRLEKDLKYDWLMGILVNERDRLVGRNDFSGFSVPDSLALEEINEYFGAKK